MFNKILNLTFFKVSLKNEFVSIQQKPTPDSVADFETERPVSIANAKEKGR